MAACEAIIGISKTSLQWCLAWALWRGALFCSSRGSVRSTGRPGYTRGCSSGLGPDLKVFYNKCCPAHSVWRLQEKLLQLNESLKDLNYQCWGLLTVNCRVLYRVWVSTCLMVLFSILHRTAPCPWRSCRLSGRCSGGQGCTQGCSSGLSHVSTSINNKCCSQPTL